MDKILDCLSQVNKSTVLTHNLIAFKSQCETLAFICKVRMVTLPLPLYVTSVKCLVLATLHVGMASDFISISFIKKKKTDAILGQSELKGTYQMRGRPRAKEQVSLTPLPRHPGALLPLQYLLVAPWLLRAC